MRKYLTWVDGNKAESGNFLAGLEKAGVPEEVLWGPSRVLSTKGGTKTINDLLWLPTEREMYGKKSKCNEETAQDQPRLAYYTDAASCKKVNRNQIYKTYWLASVFSLSGTSFCGVDSGGAITTETAAIAYGCAPAFCVY
jgi:hypothetical protein